MEGYIKESVLRIGGALTPLRDICVSNVLGGGISIEDGFGVTFLHYWISSSKIRTLFEYLSDV